MTLENHLYTCLLHEEWLFFALNWLKNYPKCVWGCINIWVHLSGALNFMKSALAASHQFPSCQMGTSKWPVNKTCTPRSFCHIVHWTALSPEESPQTKAPQWRGRPWRLYLIPPCHSHGTHINHSPPASDPSSSLDAIRHRSLGSDMLLKSSTNLPKITILDFLGGC